MAPSGHHPRSGEGAPASRSTPGSSQRVLDEAPTSIAKKLTKLEKTQRTLRILSARVIQNNMLNPVTGTDPARFVLGIVSSIKHAEERLFGEVPITLINTKSAQYIDPPRKEGRKQPPLVTSNFLLGERLPGTLAQDPKISQFIHDSYLEFEALEEGGKPLYLFPVEAGIQGALARTIISKEPKEKLIKKEDFMDLSVLSVYLPFGLKEARDILINHEVHDGAPLDIDKIHDNLNEVTVVQFEGAQRKTSLPFAILKLEGGATFRLYPYGNYPPANLTPQGCEIISSGEKYYLVMPEIVAKQMEQQLMSKHLSP